MKTIKSMKQLREEKRKLASRRSRLEEDMRQNWKGLKENLKPATLAAGAIDKMKEQATEEKLSESGVLKSTLTYGLTLLAQKFADKAEEKMKKVFKKNK